MNPNTIIHADNVCLYYKDTGDEAIENASFDIYSNETLALIGANGSGKSTLLKGILGLKKPLSGKIELKKGVRLSYLAQNNTLRRDFPATVGEIVLSGTLKPGIALGYSKKAREKALSAMEFTGITKIAHKTIGELSGGQQQRVHLARALSGEGDVLILDEPTSALDPNITEELYALFDRLKKELNKTLIVSTHDMNFVKNYCDRVMVIDKTVKYLGQVNDYFKLDK